LVFGRPLLRARYYGLVSRQNAIVIVIAIAIAIAIAIVIVIAANSMAANGSSF